MKYKNLEKEYEKIYTKIILPFIKSNIKKDFKSAPVYYLLEKLNINRFRSGLPIIIAREYNLDEESMISLAALSELTFTTAMAQDDFYDDDSFREGIESAHKKFGIKETLLSCDYINHKIIAVLTRHMKNNFTLEIINDILYIINSELSSAYASVLMELGSKKDLFSINEIELEEIYLSKTAHGRMLLECAFLLISKSKSVDKYKIKEYSKHLAIAGQLKNDIYDFTKHKKYRGFSDLRNGYITWPLFLVTKSFNNKEKDEFRKKLTERNYIYLLEILKDKKMIQKTIGLINYHVEEAKKLTKYGFPSNIKKLLNLWAEGNRHFSKEPRL